MKCNVCGQEYGVAHNCAGVAAAMTQEEAAPSPEGFAPLYYLRLAFSIVRWDDISIRRASRDSKALPYGAFLLDHSCHSHFAIHGCTSNAQDHAYLRARDNDWSRCRSDCRTPDHGHHYIRSARIVLSHCQMVLWRHRNSYRGHAPFAARLVCKRADSYPRPWYAGGWDRLDRSIDAGIRGG